MRKIHAAPSALGQTEPKTSSSIDRLLFFDRDFNPVENLLGNELPASVKPAASFWEHFPELDKSAITLALRSLGDSAQPLQISGDLGTPASHGLTIYRIGDLFAVVRSEESADDERATLLHLATHDPLTGLPNRRQFSEDLAVLLREAAGSNETLSLMQLDLDDFKPVNDTLGHPAGDKLLQLAASRIQECLTRDDRAYRLAGDEFTVISRGPGHPAKGHRLAEALVDAFKKPFTIDGIALFVGASIGISAAPPDGTTPEQLMKASDVALYAAKKDGRGRARPFDPSMLELLEQRELLRRSLRMALVQEQFSIEYQPIAEGGSIVGFEALLRWNHPLLGKIPPTAFIPMAEADGMMPEIGAWVLEQACREAMKWPQNYIVAVNLSAAEFLTSGLTDRVSQTLDLIGLPPDRLELEITESVLLERTVNNIDTLNTLNVLGIRISLDDFGTEYSSLSYLKTFPFDTIKIDKYFITDLESDLKGQAIVRCIVNLAHDLDMQVTAEGVETPGQAEWLRSVGCDRLQGYLISRPLPVEAIGEFITRAETSVSPALPQ
ncbi:EAL domain-containing protein [Rhizobium leguminosarum]|uniref:putative bifunctional diguanylate cyclase/phosphodiesterase n=1 Tax=Rhizobium leguminosarum TaxID=384 RepID=UPI0003F793FD|nr:bifunctional diguanylate cyclase/phosphodiesterase [Rhizobium leguminosarum]MBY5313492.1 bifunctional diguanylate cyclase/phosphodiesterase [Rhizobium leguminosarum]MBY5327327.1 bifunctional diguanylate cyclase/phosphodiesterase [Rhizobium leguminosarum]MBY5395203.1 bifunctional diguanylate cyclase/phosphodiesterase [Rhizobium leguminosarum]NEH47218.1 EAL domain-containing protein [Rhizobium leguminosarum]NEH56896.1 EAL domain-containing protein [Rhizobium leguminosarum]